MASDFFWQSSPSPTKLRYLQWARGKTALDIGAGRGFYAQALAKRGFDVVAVDLSPQPGVGVAIVQGRISALPFGHRFDTVLAFDVLEHEADDALSLHQLRRITGERLLLSVPNAADQLLYPYNLAFKHHIDKTHQREYTISALQHKLEVAGFTLLHVGAENSVSPAVLAEFVRPAALRKPVSSLLKALNRLRILHRAELMADIFAVATLQG